MKTRRVLLLAMSGVRVKSDELRRLGMTLPGFIERGQVIASLPTLSLLTLAAHTPENWEVEYREIDELTDGAAAQIAAAGYDIVAISALTARILDAYEIADQLREAGVTVVLGGLHVTALPEEALAHADAIVVGEAELLWPELLSDFETGALRPRYSSMGSQRRFDLAQARVPRYNMLDVGRYNRLTLQTSRGCPLDCEFCGASRLISPLQDQAACPGTARAGSNSRHLAQALYRTGGRQYFRLQEVGSRVGAAVRPVPNPMVYGNRSLGG